MTLYSRIFDDTEIRIVRIDGDPWLVAADVADALNIGRTQEATRRLDDDEKGVSTIHTPGGPQEMTVINEAGTYRLIFTSRKDAAERFKRWLAHDVLPSIRQTGQYQAPATKTQETPDMDPLEVLSKVTDHLWDMKQKQDELDSRVDTIERQRRYASQQLRAFPEPRLMEDLAATRKPVANGTSK